MHKEIESLLELALADGKITDKERAVIVKKAKDLGIDQDEVEMFIDSKLHQYNKETNYTQIKCPSCGNKISGLSKTCVCGYVLNTGTIKETRSLEASIETLENLIVQVRGISNSSSKENIELLIAKIDKEIRYIKTRYSENFEIKKLIIELETISSTFIKKAKSKARVKRTISIVSYSIILLVLTFLIYKKYTKKTASEKFSHFVNSAYLEPYLKYKSSKQNKIDSQQFYNLFIISRLRLNDLADQTFADSINQEWDKFESKVNPISEFKYYLKASECEFKGDKESAKKYLDTAIILNPKFSPNYYKLSSLIQDNDSSIKYLSYAISLDKKIGYIYLPYRAINYRQKYEDKKAIDDLTIYLESYPKNLPLDLLRYTTKLAFMYDVGLKDAACNEYNKLSSNQKSILKEKLIDTYNLFEKKCK